MRLLIVAATEGELVPLLSGLPEGWHRLDRLVTRCRSQVESMEGAAFMYACLIAGVPFAQIRAVSNYVERRNRAAWQIPEALEALGRTTSLVVADLCDQMGDLP